MFETIPEKIIEIKNISFSYTKNNKALDQISLDIRKGQIVGLLGPNGGGKTTLFKIISSLIRTYEGEIIVEGQDHKKNLFKILSRMGVVFQSPSLDKKLTVEENLIYHGYLYGFSPREIKSKIDYFLESLSMSNKRNELVGDLSGGQARRIEIVKSLLHSPSILILDEPSSGLDIGVRIDLWNLLKKIQVEQSLTILLTTHFIEEADRCDHIVLLNQGKILSSGSPKELKSRLSFKQFQVKPYNLQITQKWLQERHKIPSQIENDFLMFRVEPSIARSISDELSPEVDELTYRDPSLEDVFVHFSGRKIVESTKQS